MTAKMDLLLEKSIGNYVNSDVAEQAAIKATKNRAAFIFVFICDVIFMLKKF
jgi:hypothetical protein